MILHLERKFTAPTETFIANQINFQTKYKSIAFTTKYLNTLNVNAEVFTPVGESFLTAKLLRKSEIDQFLTFYNEKKPALVHGHFLTDAAFFQPLSKHLNIPKICSGYGYDVSSFPKKYFGFGKTYFKKIFKEYDAFLAMSNDMAADFIKLGCPKEKIIVHYYGTDTYFFNVERSYLQKNIFTILTIASLVPKKGHINVLKALRQFKTLHPSINFQYNIVGKGPLLENLDNYVKSNNLENNVTFCGLIKHGDGLLDMIKQADIFLHPSITDAKGNKEGIPGTVVEAMASGLPVISTFHAGIPEIITDKFDGLLVKENVVNEITDLIYELYNSKELRENIGSNAKSTALNKLDIRTKTKELEDIYERMLNK